MELRVSGAADRMRKARFTRDGISDIELGQDAFPALIFRGNDDG